jgi:hypothetical protein
MSEVTATGQITTRAPVEVLEIRRYPWRKLRRGKLFVAVRFNDERIHLQVGDQLVVNAVVNFDAP